MNEWLHFFIKIYLSQHFIRKGWCWLCVRGELETGTDCYILTQSSSVHSSTLFHILAGLLNCGSLRSTSPQSASWFSRWHLVSNWFQLQLELELTQAVCGTWLYFCLTPTCFLWAYASAPNSTMSTGQGDIPISLTGCTYFAVLPLIYTGASLDWWLSWGSICYTHTHTHTHTYIYIFRLHWVGKLSSFWIINFALVLYLFQVLSTVQ